MASNIWQRTTQTAREETCHRLAEKVLLYAASHRQDSIYHSLCYTSRGALAGTRNSLMGVQLKLIYSNFSFTGHTQSTINMSYFWKNKCISINADDILGF